MRKKLAGMIAGLLLVASFCLPASAADQPETINSPLREPVVSVTQEGIYYVYKFYGEYYDSHDYTQHKYQVIEVTVKSEHNDLSVYYAFNTDMGNICSAYSFIWSKKTYDAITGEIWEDYGYTEASHATTDQWALAPSDKLYWFSWSRPGYVSPVHLVKPEQMTIIKRQTGALSSQKESFINFKNTLDATVYYSYTSEPVADDFNRYAILAGEGKQYLIWINIRLRDFDALTYAWDIETDDPNVSDFVTYNEVVKDQCFLTPTLKFLASGQSVLSLECNQQLLDYYLQYIPSAQSTMTSYVAFECLITAYNLRDGQYVKSTYISNFDTQQTYMDIDATSFFGPCSDYDSIAVYGLNFYNQTSRPLNRLACIWQTDPLFVSWRDDMYDKVCQIYDILSGENQQYETQVADTEAMEDAQSALNDLKITDAQGNEIHAGQAAASGFEAAESAIADLAAPVQQINSLITDWVFGVNPLIYLPLIVALALGLLVTIIGKNKSD